jgi:NADPH:quinone reductase-like Zn-dependent oxidoreductase
MAMSAILDAIGDPGRSAAFLRRYGRLSPLAARHDLPYHVIGSDLAGVVLRTGPGVTAWQPGEEVVAHPRPGELDRLPAAGLRQRRLVGLSVLSGGHAELVPDVLRRLRAAGAGDIPVTVGGIIPPADAAALRAQGVAAVFTPADTHLTEIVGRLVDEIRRARDLPPWPQDPARTMKG